VKIGMAELNQMTVNHNICNILPPRGPKILGMALRHKMGF